MGFVGCPELAARGVEHSCCESPALSIKTLQMKTARVSAPVVDGSLSQRFPGANHPHRRRGSRFPVNPASEGGRDTTGPAFRCHAALRSISGTSGIQRRKPSQQKCPPPREGFFCLLFVAAWTKSKAEVRGAAPAVSFRRHLRPLLRDRRHRGGGFLQREAMISEPAGGRPFAGQDAGYSGVAPAYTDNGDETVSDLVTDLRWQQADDGVARNWEEGLAYCEHLELAGQADWRARSRAPSFGYFSGTLRKVTRLAGRVPPVCCY